MLCVVWSSARAIRRRCVLGIGDVVCLGDAARCDGRSVGAPATRLLRRFAALGGVRDLLCCGHERLVFFQRAILELVAGIRVAIDLSRVSLAATTGAELLSLPVSLGKGGIAVLVAMRAVVQQVFLGADSESIHHRV